MIQPLRLEIPEQLMTERLSLRAVQPADGATVFDSVQASLPELKAFMPWATDAYSIDDSFDWCRRSAGRFITREDIGYLIFLQGSTRHVGTITAWSKGWDVPRFEIGYWLATHETGHGYMTEAVAAITEMIFGVCQARRVEIRTDAKNVRSRRVAERSGYLLEGILKNECRENDQTLRDTCIFAMTR